MEKRTLEIRITERESSTGKKFKTYHTFSKNGRKTDVKFKSTVTNAPVKNCFIVVNDDEINLNTTGKYPVLWVSNILEITTEDKESAVKNRKKLAEYFD